MFASSFEAAATDMRSLLRSSNILHWTPRLRSQNWQSAAPPAMVPRRNGLISIIFLTVWDAGVRSARQKLNTHTTYYKGLHMYGPMVARESTETMTPP